MVVDLLNRYVRPAAQEDGGDIVFESYEKGIEPLLNEEITEIEAFKRSAKPIHGFTFMEAISLLIPPAAKPTGLAGWKDEPYARHACRAFTST